MKCVAVLFGCGSGKTRTASINSTILRYDRYQQHDREGSDLFQAVIVHNLHVQYMNVVQWSKDDVLFTLDVIEGLWPVVDHSICLDQ